MITANNGMERQEYSNKNNELALWRGGRAAGPAGRFAAYRGFEIGMT
jgi:hypothetical protein